MSPTQCCGTSRTPETMYVALVPVSGSATLQVRKTNFNSLLVLFCSSSAYQQDEHDHCCVQVKFARTVMYSNDAEQAVNTSSRVTF